MDIYWSPLLAPQIQSDFLLYIEPISLYKLLKNERNLENNHDNYFHCPAFLKSISNTFVVCSSFSFNIGIDYSNNSFFPLDESSVKACEHFSFKATSRLNTNTINFFNNLIYFCENSVNINTTPAFLHRSEFQTKCTYIPGNFDIGQWFRPVEGALEIYNKFETISIKKGDPLYYIQFQTQEVINLKKFYTTDSIHEISKACIRLKDYKTARSLKDYYLAFKSSKIKTRLLKEIRSNLL
jgi:hypothetical protein